MFWRAAVLLLVIFAPLTSRAQDTYGPAFLTPDQVQRLKIVQQLLQGVETKSFQQLVNELKKAPHRELNLEIKEATAHAYTDIASLENVQGQKKKQWLYSMVCLNMAYLQFGGTQGAPGSTTELNRLIRKKLKAYLPPHTLKELGVIYSLE